MLHKISKLDVFPSMFHCKSCARNFPQKDNLSSVCHQFDQFLVKTFNTISFRTKNLFYHFSIVLVRHTVFLFACGKTRN